MRGVKDWISQLPVIRILSRACLVVYGPCREYLWSRLGFRVQGGGIQLLFTACSMMDPKS